MAKYAVKKKKMSIYLISIMKQINEPLMFSMIVKKHANLFLVITQKIDKLSGS